MLENVNYPDATRLWLRLEVLRGVMVRAGAGRDDKTNVRIIAFNLAVEGKLAGILVRAEPWKVNHSSLCRGRLNSDLFRQISALIQSEEGSTRPTVTIGWVS
jgi:hypothetical protein